MIEKIRKIIEAVVGGDKKFLVMASERPEFGNYSTNAAFLLSKESGKSPIEVAKDLAAKIADADKGKFFSRVEAAPPGYVNFWLSPEALQKGLNKVLKIKRYTPYPKPLKINLEFISANPTGPLTMANGRGGFWGDVLANIFKFAGHKVTREYYINDAGNQIKLLGESILAALGKISPKEEHYQGGYIKELADRLRNTKYIRMYEKRPEELGRIAAQHLLKQIKTSVKDAGIKFGVWFSEFKKLRGSTSSPQAASGLIKKVLAILDKKGLVVDKEGAKWLKTSEIADEKDRVLVKSDGQPTYFLADMAYHYDKFINRKFELAIDIWGADHHGYVARLKSGIKALGIDPKRLKIIITQLVRLVEGGQEVRMSKRKGEFVTLDELVAEVGKDATRFFFLLHTPETHMDFDLALAKERSLKNPVYYVQYAFVRANSILTKAKRKAQSANVLNELNTEAELALVSELVKLPYMVQQTAEDYQINRLARYAMEVARDFHNFYEKERVISESGEAVPERLALVMAAKNILEKLFSLLGIAAPEKM